MPYKTARAAELFWLVASIATSLYVLYLWWTEDLTRWTLGLQSLEAAKLERWESSESAEETPDVWHVDGGFTLYIGGTQAKHNAKLSAVRGTYDDEAGRLEAWEEVVLVNEEGERLETEHLMTRKAPA